MSQQNSSQAGVVPPTAKKRIRLLPVWFSMGSTAFRRSFRCKPFGCEEGGRDFAWLTLLLSLVICLALLLVGSRSGFLDRLTDSLLGTLRPHGVPIWVTSHWENNEGIQRQLLEQLDRLSKPAVPAAPAPNHGVQAAEPEPLFSAHPYRRLANNSPRVQMPNSSVWKSSPPFVGWAVYPDDPLWQLGKSGMKANIEDDLPWWRTPPFDKAANIIFGKNLPTLQSKHQGTVEEKPEWLGLPLEIILSENLFAEQFDYGAYRESLEPFLSKEEFNKLPPRLWQNSLTMLETLWLKATVSHEEHLVPFKVTWVSHIPAMEKIAFLFPLSTYHALQAAHHLSELTFAPGNQGISDRDQWDRLMDPSYPRDQIIQYALCVQEEVNATGLSGLPQIQTDRCQPPKIFGRSASGAVSAPAQEGFDGTIDQRDGEKAQPDTLNHDGHNWLWMPCHRLPRNDAMRGSLCPSWESASDEHGQFVPWDVTSYGNSFGAIHVFTRDPTSISDVIETLMSIRTPDGRQALNIHPMYQDALNRFNLLSDILATMVPVYAITFIALLSTLLFAQIGTLVDHRRNHYGILLSHGFTWLTLHAKLLVQLGWATLAAALITIFGLVPLLRHFLERGFDQILTEYQDRLPPGHGLEVLPLPFWEVMVTIGAVFMVVMVVAFLLGLKLPLRPGTTPSDLLHSDLNAGR
ncbi:MAG: hypothetical protein HQL54_09710 [Magnetococcales bacterium]|nr:hypothetical protein [Magnetococcales bacterium]